MKVDMNLLEEQDRSYLLAVIQSNDTLWDIFQKKDSELFLANKTHDKLLKVMLAIGQLFEELASCSPAEQREKLNEIDDCLNALQKKFNKLTYFEKEKELAYVSNAQ